MKSLLSFASGIDSLIAYIGRKASLLNLVLIIIICLDVFFRMTMDYTSNWILELEWHVFSIIFMLGLSYAWQFDKHVRVDLLYENWSTRRKSWINLIGILVLTIPWCLIILHTGWEYAANSFSFREKSPQPNGLPARYIIKFFICIGFGLLLLQAIAKVIQHVDKLRDGKNIS